MKKKANNQSAQDFLNMEDITGNLIYTTDKHLIGFLSLAGSDNSLLQESEHERLTAQMSAALADETEPWQIISIPRTVDTQRVLENLNAMRQQCENNARLQLLDGEIHSLQELSDDREPMIVLKCWVKAAPGADKELLHRLSLLSSRLSDSQISARILEDQQLKYLCKIYSDLGVSHDMEEPEEDITILEGRKRRWREQRALAEQQRAALLDELAPVGGFFFEPNRIRIGSAVLRCYAVTRYPSQVSYGWASALTTATDAVTCITFYPGRAADLGNAISKEARRAARDATAEADLRQRKTYERQIQGAGEMLDTMDSQGGAIGHMAITVMVIARDDAGLEQNCQRVMTRFSVRRLRLKALANVQKAAFMHLSPFYTAQDLIADMSRHIVPLDTLVGGYPATISTIRDDNGVYFAQTMDNGHLFLDLLLRDADRTNGNGILTGTPGIGKSTVAKHLAQSMYMRGAKVIIIDPQGEYREMCQALGGSWWDAGGGKAKNNPLQIRCFMDEEEGEKSASPMAQHLQALYIILRYKLPGLTDLQFELLKRVLRQVYEEFGITLDQQEFSADPNAYPLFSDVYTWLLHHAAENPEYNNLALFLEDMSVGAEAQLWNGPTDMDLDSDLVVIDTSKLSDAPTTTQAAQYHNLLRLAYSEATKDKRPCVIIADEGHLLFDPTVPEAGSLVKRISKQIRKYEGCFWLVTQSLADMLHDRVSLYGQAVVDNAAYKLLMGCDGRNLAQATELFHLNRAEENLLEARQRGVALCLIGSRHIKAKFVLSPYKLELMGSGGGR